MDDFLYNTGVAVPILLVFSVVAAIGYRIRSSEGLYSLTGFVAAVLAFGVAIGTLGQSLDQRSAAAAVGSAAASSAVVFFVAYKMQAVARTHYEAGGVLQVCLAYLSSVLIAALVSTSAALYFLGLQILGAEGSYVQSLLWSSALTLFVNVALFGEPRKLAAESAEPAVSKPTASDHVDAPQTSPSARGRYSSRWNISRPDKP